MGKDISPEFDKCLKEGKIRPFLRRKEVFLKELKTAQEDLESAKESFKNKKFKWATIQSYYSMFHTARAFLYSHGYRERSHYCLIMALRTLFVSKRKLDYRLVEILVQGKKLRESADYYDTWSESGAQQMISSAEDFLKEAKKLLEKK